MNRKAAELRDVLLKCSKAELIEVIIRAEGFTYTHFRGQALYLRSELIQLTK